MKPGPLSLKSSSLRILCVLCASAVIRCPAAEPAVPDWSLGVLSFRQLGVTLDRAGVYVDGILPGTGSLAKNAVANTLFKLPIDAALQHDGPAAIYLLEPFNPGPDQDMATVLPVADAGALKANLAATFGAPVEQDGVLAFTLPQPLPNPDKTMLVKIAGGRALIAPSAEALKKLEDWLAQPQPNTPQTADAVLTLNVKAFKRLYEKQVLTALSLGALAATGDMNEAEKLVPRMERVVRVLWQLDTIEARLNFEANGGARMDFAVRPSAGSELSAHFAKPAAAVNDVSLRVLPEDSACVITWSANPAQLLEPLTAFLESQASPTGKSTAANKNALEFMRSLISVFDTTTGAGALSVNPTHAQNLQVLWTAPANEAGKSDEAVAASYKLFNVLVNQASAELAADPSAASLFALLAAQHREAGGNVLFSIGEDPAANMQAAVDRIAANGPLADELKPDLSAVPAGAFVFGALHPLPLARFALAQVLPPDGVSAAQLTAGLPDAMLSFAVFAADTEAGLRVTIPPKVPAALFRLHLRMNQAHVKLMDLLSGAHPPDAPAPPPPEP